MKAMMLGLAVVAVVIGVSAYVVHTDPNRAETRAAFTVLHEKAYGIPQDSAAVGYLDLGKHDQEEFNREFSLDRALKETQSRILLGTLLKQDYLLRQAEYKLAQIRSVGGDTTVKELEEKRSAYADATRRFQTFLGN